MSSTDTITSTAGPQSSGPSVLTGDVHALGSGTVVDAVAALVAGQPDAAAVEGDGPVLTYAELWQHAGRMAEVLVEAGVESGDQVAVWATRTAPVVAAALAVMALGAAYVPIDPTYPVARVRRILEVGRPKVMVCADPGSLAGSLPRGVAAIDTHAGPRDATPLVARAKPEQVAYTVFTTGSTGLPKGVLVDHRSLLNYLGWAAELTGFEPGDATPCFASLGFDHAVTCLWLPLMAGGSVQLVPDSWDPRPWLAPRERPFAFVKITPSHVRLFERIAHPDYRAITRTVMFGGERLEAALVASLGERLEGVRLLNHYGPTEATVGCTAYRFDRSTLTDREPSASGDEDGTAGHVAVPIGAPVWNSRAYVVDEELRPVQLGDEGELVLAGDCVAVGYLGGDDQDRARFCTEADIGDIGAGGQGAAAGGPASAGGGASAGGPASAGGGASAVRAYRTGDRCVVRQGQLHYLGRLDEQVKVRGHRIEIHEVRDLASSVDGVAQAAAAVSQAGLGGLELFVVPAEGAEDGLVPRVLSKLRGELPAAAVPERVWIVPNLVVNAHGKWDADATRALAQSAAADDGGPAPQAEQGRGS